MWLVELFFGMFLGYYVMSRTIRCLVNDLIWLVVKSVLVRRWRKIPQKVTLPKVETKITPKFIEALKASTPSGISVITSEEEIERWMNQNPALRKVNEAVK